jgi:hypothetical protein
VTSVLKVGLLTFRAVNLVSILNVSKVPALVVMLSSATTFEVPDRFQAPPLVLLVLLA